MTSPTSFQGSRLNWGRDMAEKFPRSGEVRASERGNGVMTRRAAFIEESALLRGTLQAVISDQCLKTSALLCS